MAAIQCAHMLLDCVAVSFLFLLGGYNFPNTARLWTYCTALALGEELDNDIPEHEVNKHLSSPYYMIAYVFLSFLVV